MPKETPPDPFQKSDQPLVLPKGALSKEFRILTPKEAERLGFSKTTPRSPERKRETGISIEQAKEILGQEEVLGPEAVEATFGFRPEDTPPIPFSAEELERAEKMGQMLVLRVEQTEDGKPMSLETMNGILVKKWGKEGKGEILKTADGWKNWIGEYRFKKEAPRSGWALVSKDLLPDSTSKNYIEQTDVIIKALREEAFKDIEMPEEYEEAIREFEANKDRLTKLMGTNWQEAAKQLSELKITKLTRQIFPEAIYDIAMYHDRHNKRMLSGKYTWTSSLSPGGYLVDVGGFGAEGVGGSRRMLYDRYSGLGASLSRSL